MPSLHAFLSSLLPFSSLVYLIMSGPLRNRDGKDTGWRWRGSGVGGEKVKTRIDRRNVLDGNQSINQSISAVAGRGASGCEAQKVSAVCKSFDYCPIPRETRDHAFVPG